MSIAGIASSALSNYSLHAIQSNRLKWQQGLEQLGQDLQSGNLSAAQSDFTALQKLAPQAASTSASQGTSPAAQDFSQLGKDLQAGNTSAAQQDFQQLQQTVSPTASGALHHHHHGANNGSNPMSQLLQQLGQALQAGNLSSAQQAYTVLQQQLQTMGQAGSTQSSSELAVNA